jgi:peptide/nickel transport system substrate-binding protein
MNKTRFSTQLWRQATLTLACVTLSASLSGAVLADDTSHLTPVTGGVLTVGLGSDTPVIDPSITAYSVAALVARNVVDSLVGQAADNHFTPWLAQSWEVNDNNTQYTFHLRQDVTFSDGTRLDAAAVKYNFDRILDPKTISPYAKSLLGPVTSVTTPDNDTVVIHYQQPFAPLLQGLSLPYLGIQSPTYLKNTPNTSNTLVGSGPFVLDSFVKGSGSKLTKRQDYHWGPGYASHQGPAYLDRIEFKYLPEAAVRLGALSSGQVQAIDAVPPVNFAQVKKDPHLTVVTYEDPGVNRVLYLNSTQGVFQDVAIRRAFQSAVNSDSAVKAAFFGTLKAADNVLGPKTLDYDPSVAKLWGFDLKRANQLLDEAGWSTRDSEGYRTKNGKRLSARFVYVPSNVEAADVVLFQAVQFQVKQVGFDLQLEPVDAGIFASRTANNDYDIASNFFVRPEPDILRTVFHSAYIPPQGNNYVRLTSLDGVLSQAVGANDATRKQLYQQVQHQVIEQAYVVPLYIPAFQLGLSQQLQGVNWATNAKPNFYDAWLRH